MVDAKSTRWPGLAGAWRSIESSVSTGQLGQLSSPQARVSEKRLVSDANVLLRSQGSMDFETVAGCLHPGRKMFEPGAR